MTKSERELLVAGFTLLLADSNDTRGNMRIKEKLSVAIKAVQEESKEPDTRELTSRKEHLSTDFSYPNEALDKLAEEYARQREMPTGLTKAAYAIREDFKAGFWAKNTTIIENLMTAAMNNVNLMELVKAQDDWIKRCYDITKSEEESRAIWSKITSLKAKLGI